MTQTPEELAAPVVADMKSVGKFDLSAALKKTSYPTQDVILNLDRIEHVITGVGTTDGYSVWHIYADLGDVVELKVGWSSGNPFYYGYGFDIAVVDA